MSGDIFDVPVPEARSDTDERIAALEEALSERLLVLDGATGTAMQARDRGPEEFGGPELEGCNENLCALRPDVVELVHDTYLKAGADIVETNTVFGNDFQPWQLTQDGFIDKIAADHRAISVL